MPIQVRRLRRRVPVFTTPPTEAEVDPAVQALMTELGVRREGDVFRYEVCRFDRLDDALSFARSQAAPLAWATPRPALQPETSSAKAATRLRPLRLAR